MLNHTNGRVVAISIHAPHAGSDVAFSTNFPPYVDFNPRSPRGERPSSRKSR